MTAVAIFVPTNDGYAELSEADAEKYVEASSAVNKLYDQRDALNQQISKQEITLAAIRDKYQGDTPPSEGLTKAEFIKAFPSLEK